MKGDSQGLEKLIAGKLRAQLHGGGPECPEVETLAAYVDQALTRGERESLQTHLAVCARCQEQVAELIRLSEAEEPAKALVLGPAPARRIAWFRWAMAAPALAGLLVAALWYTGEFRPLLRQQEQVALKAPPARTVPAAPPELKEAQAPTSQPPRQEVAKAPPQKETRPEAVLGWKMPALKPAPAEPGAARAVPEVGVATENLAVSAPGAIAAPSERARLATAAHPAKQGEEAVSAAREDRLAMRAEAPAPPAAAPQAEREKAPEETTAVAGGTAFKAQETLGLVARGGAAKKVMAPLPAGKWRVGRRGLIERADANGNWTTQASGVEANLLDIAFATPSVGWVVGLAGTVLRTSDGGTTWNQVPIPTRAELIRVTASGEYAARVVTRDGQTLTTTDGGKCWNVSPQD
jgi:hypothetical protein